MRFTRNTQATSYQPYPAATGVSVRLNFILASLLLFSFLERQYTTIPLSQYEQPQQVQECHCVCNDLQQEKVETKQDLPHEIIDEKKASPHYYLGDETERYTKNGFHPVWVYRNPQTAASEVPERHSTPHNKGFRPAPYSQAWQDKMILALTKANNQKLGAASSASKFFVDLASNDAIILSNSLYLEQMGWEGVCIEGNHKYWYHLARYRKCQVIAAFVGGKEDGLQADIVLKGVGGGIVGNDMDNKKPGKKRVTVQRDLVSLETVFRETNTPRVIDYFSLDVEGAESLIMTDFPWQDYQCRFVTIERPKDDLRQMLAEHGYEYVQDLVSWGETLWVHQDLVKLSIDEIKDIVSRVQNEGITKDELEN